MNSGSWFPKISIPKIESIDSASTIGPEEIIKCPLVRRDDVVSSFGRISFTELQQVTGKDRFYFLVVQVIDQVYPG